MPALLGSPGKPAVVGFLQRPLKPESEPALAALARGSLTAT